MLIFFNADRESARLKLIPEEHERRRAIFLELLNMDCRMVSTIQFPWVLSTDIFKLTDV